MPTKNNAHDKIPRTGQPNSPDTNKSVMPTIVMAAASGFTDLDPLFSSHIRSGAFGSNRCIACRHRTKKLSDSADRCGGSQEARSNSSRASSGKAGRLFAPVILFGAELFITQKRIGPLLRCTSRQSRAIAETAQEMDCQTKEISKRRMPKVRCPELLLSPAGRRGHQFASQPSRCRAATLKR